MAFLDDAKGKLPREGKGAFASAMLIAFIRDNKIKSAKELGRKLSEDIEKCRVWLVKNKPPTSTASTEQREYTRKLEQLSLMLKAAEKYMGV